MRLFFAGPGMEREVLIGIAAQMQLAAELEQAYREAGVPLQGQPVFVAVFSPNDAMLDVEHEVRRVLQTLAHAARLESAA